MLLTIALFLGSALAIYLACEFFVNGVEWVGRRLAMGETATGSLLAAFGTALPESTVTIVAVTLGASEAAREIGVGAAIGGPLALSTIAYAVVGVTLWRCRGRFGEEGCVQTDTLRLSHDQLAFLVIFAVKIALGLVAFAVKPWLGWLFLGAYALYSWRELRRPATADEGEIEPLRLRPGSAQPGLGWALLQTVLALLVIFIASRLFVDQIAAIGPWLGLPAQLSALLLSPIATELPETMNAIIWVRQGKERLALANISGAMMIQATVPTAFGLFFTPWRLATPALIAAAVTALSVACLSIGFRRGTVRGPALAALGLLYLLFAALVIAWR
jgi:cation:H+ antiporter